MDACVSYPYTKRISPPSRNPNNPQSTDKAENKTKKWMKKKWIGDSGNEMIATVPL